MRKVCEHARSTKDAIAGRQFIGSQLSWAWHIVRLWRRHRWQNNTWREPRLITKLKIIKIVINRAVKSLKNGKSAGTDCIQLELLKHAELIAPRLTNLFNDVWQNKEVDTERRNGITVPFSTKVTDQTIATAGLSCVAVSLVSTRLASYVDSRLLSCLLFLYFVFCRLFCAAAVRYYVYSTLHGVPINTSRTSSVLRIHLLERYICNSILDQLFSHPPIS